MARSAKRLLALLLALMMCVSLLPATALAEGEEETAGTIRLADAPDGENGAIAPAEEPDALPPADETQEATSGQCGDDLTWTLDENGTLTITGTGDMWDWNDGNSAPWSDRCWFIQNLVVEPGVTSIGNYAFYFFYDLNSLDLPDSVERIGDYAFNGCGLCEFHVPSDVKVLSVGTLHYSRNLRAVYLPSGLERIEERAFAACGLLKDLYYDGTIAAWTALYEQMLINEEEDFWTKIATIHCSDGEIAPQGQYCGVNATWTLENGVLTISGTGSTWDMISGHGCWSTLQDQITSIVVEEGITGINRHSFYQLNQVTSVSLPQSLVSIGQGAFMRMSNLESLTLPEGLQVFEHEVFIGTGLRSISLPEGLTTLPQRTFQECRNLKTVELPSSIRTIEEGAFRWASALESIEIPAGVTSLADLTFDGCTSLHDVWFRGSAPDFTGCNFENTQTGTYTFRDVTATVHYPAGDPSWTEEVRQNYGGNITWEAYENVVTVLASGECGDDLTWTLTDDGVLTISGTGDMWNFAASDGGNTAVSTRGARGDQEEAPWAAYRDQICKVVVEEGVTSVGDNAFQACESLNEVVFEGDAPEISESAFAGVEATISYPEDNETWTEEVLQDYGGDLSWEPYQASPAVIASGQCGDDLTWTLDDDGTLTISGTGDMWDFEYNYEDGGNAPWADYITQVRRLVVSEGVTSLGREAFDFCQNLTEVQLPSTLVTIGDHTFMDCAFTEIHLPVPLEQIGHGAFFNCTELQDVNYDGTIGQWREINIEEDNECLMSAAIHCTDGDVDYSDHCGNNLVWSFDEETGTLNISGTGGMWSTPKPWGDFRWQIRKVVLSEGVTGIGSLAFLGCTALTEVELPSTLRQFGSMAFHDCSSLTDIEIPVGVSAIKYGLFSGCTSLASVTIPFGVTWIEDAAFESCKNLTNVTIPSSMTTISDYAFSGCSGLAEIFFKGSAPEIANFAFSEVSATVYYPAGDETWTEDVLQDYGGDLTWVPYEAEETIIAFGDCGDDLTWSLSEDYTLTITGTGDMWNFDYNFEWGRGDTPWIDYIDLVRRLVVSEGVTGLGWEAFDSCPSLMEVQLPSTLVTIGGYAFQDGAFTEIHLPVSLEQIDYGAFLNCMQLQDVYYDGTVAQWREIDIQEENDCLIKATIHCADGLVDYSNYCGNKLLWSFDEETGTLNITGTGNMWSAPLAWDGFKEQVRKVVLSEGVTGIGAYAFADCTALTEIVLPTSLYQIRDGAFKNCSSLTSFEFPSGVNSISSELFSGCTALGSITIPYGVTWIGYDAFADCQSLTSVTIPGSVTTISSDAFYNCSSLTEIRFEGNAPWFGGNAFANVTATAYYPSNFEGWTEDVLQNYGGEITWTAYVKETMEIASGECGDDLTWALTDDGVLTISGTGDMWDYEWGEAPWIEHGSRGIITSVILPDGLTGIGAAAFAYCANVAELEIPTTVTRIGNGAFFNWSSLREISIPNKVVSIGGNAFSYCQSLTSIQFPASVCSIGEAAFNGCSNLGRIRFDGSAPSIGERAFESVTATVYYPANFLGWTEAALQDYGGSLTWVPYEGEAEGIEINEQNFPDDSFRACVSGSFDVDGDGWLSEDERLTVKAVDVTGLGVADLTGIEFFTELTELRAGGDFETPGLLARVDLSANTKLVTLDLGFNPLTGLDVTMLPALESLMVGFCGLTELDLSGNPALRELWCDDNALTALDLSHNPALEHLDCCGNEGLSRLDLCPCPKLVALYLSGGRHLEWMQELDPEMYESILVYGGSGDEDYDLAVNNYTEIIYPLADGFYLIGPDWNYNGIYGAKAFEVNPETAGEYMLRTTLAAGDKLKVVRVENNAIAAWYPEGMGNEYTVDEAHAGLADVYFRTEYNDAWSAFGGHIWIGTVPVVSVAGKSLSLKGKIEVNFYLDLPGSLLADPDACVTINGEKIPIGEGTPTEVNGSTYYVFTAKVKLAQLTEDRVLRIFNGKGEPVELKDLQGNDLTETGLVYRGQDYIEYVRLNSDDAGLLAVVNALSDLGSLAQEQFQYNLEARVDVVGELSAVTADMLTDYKPTVEAETGAGVRYYGSSLLLQDVTTIRHYFKAAGGDVSGYTFTVDGVQVTPVQKGSYFYVDITGIVAKDLDRSFRVEVSGADGVLIKLDYSAMSYAYKQLNRDEEGVLTDLAKAVYLYGAAADAFFPD